MIGPSFLVLSLMAQSYFGTVAGRPASNALIYLPVHQLLDLRALAPPTYRMASHKLNWSICFRSYCLYIKCFLRFRRAFSRADCALSCLGANNGGKEEKDLHAVRALLEMDDNVEKGVELYTLLDAMIDAVDGACRKLQVQETREGITEPRLAAALNNLGDAQGKLTSSALIKDRPLYQTTISMAPVAVILLALWYCSFQAAAATLRVQIPPSNLLPNPNVLPASTHATLTSDSAPPLRAILRKGNFFEFPDIPTTGSHLLDIFAHDYVFAPYRIDISRRDQTSSSQAVVTGAWETYRGTQWADRGFALVSEPASNLTISAKVLSQKNFYEERQGFSPLSLLKNPMILLALVALAFTLGMPKLMENMDPEMRAEYEEMQRKSPMGGLTRAVQGGGAGGPTEGFDLASYLAGSSRSTAIERGADDIRARKR